jgi:regulation of enolase protein 1 (concanavalin A-like superfamily)
MGTIITAAMLGSCVLGVVLGTQAPARDAIVFQDDFDAKLGDGWSWVREDPAAWRVRKEGLEIRVQPGNMWGAANDAKNVLVRTIPEPGTGTVELSVTVTNRPTGQYEQIDLVWYYDDRHMVKIGQEQVDGVLSLVMGREEGDKTRTIAIIPIEALSLDVRFTVTGDQIRGQFRAAGETPWKEAGQTTLPVPSNGVAKASLQVYQGPPGVERWARFNAFRITRRPPHH